MKIISHRGAKGLAPENSIAAIKEALILDVDMIEVDIRLQGTEVVLSHDDTMKYETYTTLKRALDEIKGKVDLNLEIKEVGVIKHLPKIIKDYPGNILYSSFKFGALRELKKLIPNAEISIIERWSAVRAVAEASLLETKNITLNQKWLWSGVVHSLKEQGFNVYAYTVNSIERAHELESWGIDGICTDYPDRFV